MDAPTHYGCVRFPHEGPQGRTTEYRIEFKEDHTGFRPTLEIFCIQSSPQPGVTVWHPCIPGNETWRVGKHLMAAHVKHIFFKYAISYRLDGELCRMGVRRITARESC